MGSTGRPAADDFYVVVAMFKLCAVFRGEKTTHALDQPFKRFNIELIAAAKRMDDLRLGKAFFFVPDVVGKLDILDDGAVLVLAFDGTDIHAYTISIYNILCKQINYKSCAYVFGTKTPLSEHDFNNLWAFLSGKMPRTVEHGGRSVEKSAGKPGNRSP